MKNLAVTFLVLLSFIAKGLETTKFPITKQFYTQDDNQKAIVIIGFMNNFTIESGYSIRVLANSRTYFYQKGKLNGSEQTEIPISINSGLIRYDFELYQHEKGDSTLVQKSSDILCGDAFVIYGQSNGNALFGLQEFSPMMDDSWIRNFMLPDGDKELWYRAKLPDSKVGVLGLSLASRLVKDQGMPICILNGSVGGERIENLGFRNRDNPTDRTTYYGDLLARVKGAQSIKKITGFIWFQGEAETSTNAEDKDKYPGQLDTLYNNILMDFPPIDEFIVMQINLLKDGLGEAGIIRNAQSEIGEKYTKVTSLATVGQTYYNDGIHYGWPGYVSIATMIKSFFNNYHYAKRKDPSYTSPRIQKAFVDKEMGVLRLVFEKHHKVFLEDYNERPYGRRYVNPFVYINGKNNQIEAISTFANEVRLQIIDLENAESITFLPSFFSDENTRVYDGPVIKNQHGFSALTFYDFKIEAKPSYNFDRTFYLNKRKLFQEGRGKYKPCKNCKTVLDPKRDINSIKITEN